MHRSFRSLIVAVTAALTVACASRGPTRTTRPAPDLSPWSERTVRSAASGGTYSYLTLDGPSDDAPVLLLLHGGIFDNRIFYYVHPLHQTFRVVALQFPDNSLFYTGRVADWGKVVKDFCAALSIRPDYLVSVSNGAYGAIEYLLQTPDHQVRQLALISAMMFSITDEEVRKRTRMAKLALSFPPARLQRVVERRALSTDYGDAPGPIAQTDIFFVRPYSWYYQVFSVPKHQGAKKQETSRITIPVLVIHGTEDDIMPIRAARLTPDVFANATFVPMEGKGHDMVFSDAQDVVDVLLRHFAP